jgi:hypothetical protein
VKRVVACILLSLTLLAACAAEPALPTSTPPPTVATLPAATTTPDEAARLLALALEDAALRSGMPAENLRVVSVTPTTWTDSAFGCNTGVDAGVGDRGLRDHFAGRQASV